MTTKEILVGLPWHWHGVIAFKDAVADNDDLAAKSRRDGVGAVLMFEPSAPVLTLGRRASRPEGRAAIASTIAACDRRGVAVVEADRGGLATLHAPGQLVLFVALPPPIPAIPALVQELLRAAQGVALEMGLMTTIDLCDDVGLWSGSRKLGSVGLRVRDRVVLHGMSLNIAIDPRITSGLTLCGHNDLDFASIQPHVAGFESRNTVQESAVRLARRLGMRGAAPTRSRMHARPFSTE